MTIGAVFEIIAAVFAVFGAYTAVRMVLFYAAYGKEVRKSIKIAVEICEDDDRETAELKRMCARNLMRDMGNAGEYVEIKRE